MPKKKINFEVDITRLGDIVTAVEDENISLENAIALYKEGLTLVTKCGEALNKYETEVSLLQKDAAGDFVLEKFLEN